MIDSSDTADGIGHAWQIEATHTGHVEIEHVEIGDVEIEHVEIERGEFEAIAITEPKERNPWIVLTSTSLAVFAVFLDTTIGFVAFPSISATFASSGPSTLSWVLNAYTLVFAAMLIPAGRLADRVGRRKMFLIGVVVFTCGSMLCGLAPNIGLLITAEMLEAVGAAILVPASLALVLQTFPRAKIPVAVAIWGAIGAVAGAAGPTLGALVVSNLSWRWAFYINLPVGLISFFLGRAVLPEGKEANPGRLPDPPSVVLLAGGIALVTYAIVETNTWGWASIRSRRRSWRRWCCSARSSTGAARCPTRSSTSDCSRSTTSGGRTRR
jgi:MFS family permease